MALWPSVRLDLRSVRIARLSAALLVSVTVVACSASATPSASSGSASQRPAVRIVATTTILADLVSQVGGSSVAVTSLVPKGGDVHTFDPTPSVLTAVVDAQLIVSNGVGLDAWLTDVVKDSGATAPVIALGEDLPGVTYLNGEGSTANPHLWMNVAYARLYVDRIRDALIAADPADEATFRTGATTYDATLHDLDQSIKSRIAALPADHRKVVSFHDAFPYYAAAYGLTIDGTVVDAPGQDPSAGQVAALVSAIKADGVSAIISEAQFSDSLVKTIADETGATVVSDLYDDTVGDPPVDTYVGVMTYDTDHIVAALGG